jgi:hypothetical protein
VPEGPRDRSGWRLDPATSGVHCRTELSVPGQHSTRQSRVVGGDVTNEKPLEQSFPRAGIVEQVAELIGVRKPLLQPHHERENQPILRHAFISDRSNYFRVALTPEPSVWGAPILVGSRIAAHLAMCGALCGPGRIFECGGSIGTYNQWSFQDIPKRGEGA